MPAIDQHDQKFSSIESEDLAHYRTISKKAIGAVLFGILSATSLINPLMVWTSMLAVTLAIGALRTIRESRGEVFGRKAAIIGLILALIFGFWAPTAYVMRQQFIFAQAKEHSRRWLDMLRRGELQQAHQLMRPQSERQLPTQNLADYYRENAGAKEDLQLRFDASPIKEIIAIGIDGIPRFVRNVGIRLESRSAGTIEIVVQQYAIDYFVNGQPRVLDFAIELERQYIRKSGETRWYVRDALELSGVKL